MQQLLARLRAKVRAFMALLRHNKMFRFNAFQVIRGYFHFLRDYITVHQAIIGLTIFIIFSNTLIVHAANDLSSLPSNVIVSDPYVIADTVRVLAPYTPNINEDPEAIAVTLEEHVNGSFIQTNPLLASQPSESEEPSQTPTPVASGQRTRDTKYTVQIGDTLSGIGEKFDLKLATLKVKNDLSDIDTIKPGQELTIPPQDLSEKAIKAAADRQLASNTAKSATQGKKIIAHMPAGGYGIILPIHHNGVSRRLSYDHPGVDYRANVGTPVMAAADGVVTIATFGWNGGYGTTVLIAHSNGRATRYGHMSSLAVKPGEIVQQGEVIGYSGNTGRSTGPHLHFELRINGSAVDPGV